MLIAALAFTAFIAVNGTQVMHRPAAYKSTPKSVQTEQNPKTNSIQKRATNKVSFAYFTNWGIYGANFRKEQYMLLLVIYLLSRIEPTDIVPSSLTRTYADLVYSIHLSHLSFFHRYSLLLRRCQPILRCHLSDRFVC